MKVEIDTDKLREKFDHNKEEMAHYTIVWLLCDRIDEIEKDVVEWEKRRDYWRTKANALETALRKMSGGEYRLEYEVDGAEIELEHKTQTGQALADGEKVTGGDDL